MGIVVYSLLLVMQDFARQPFHPYSGAGGVLKGLTAVLHCSTVSFSTPSFYHYHSPPTKENPAANTVKGSALCPKMF